MDQSIIDSFAGQEPQTGAAACDTSSAPPSAAAMAVSAKPAGRPWLRLFARSFDILLFSLAAEALLCFVWPSLASRNFLLVGLVPGILLYFLVDALLMAAFGTTPGKYLLRIAVVPDTWQPITLRQALGRSFNVGWHGLAFGLPVANLFKLFGARKRLLEKGQTRWDEKGHFDVLHQEAGLLGPLVLVFVSALLVLTGSVLSYLINDRRPDVLPEYRSVKVASPEHALPSITSVIPTPPVLERDGGGATPHAADPLSGTAPESSVAPPASTTGRQDADSSQDAAQITKMVMADLNQPVAAAKTPRQETGTAGRHVKKDAPPATNRRLGHAGHTGQYAAPADTYQSVAPVYAPSEEGYAGGRTLSGKKGTQQAHQAADRASLGNQAGRPVPETVVHAARTAPASITAPGQPEGDSPGAATNVGRPALDGAANDSQATGGVAGRGQDVPGSAGFNDQAARNQDANAGNAAVGATAQADTPVTHHPGQVRSDDDLPPQQPPASVQGAVTQDRGAPVVALGDGQIASRAGDSRAREGMSPGAARLFEEKGGGEVQAPVSGLPAATSPASDAEQGTAGAPNDTQDAPAAQGVAGKVAALSPARPVVQDVSAARPGGTTRQPDMEVVPTVTQQDVPVTADVTGVPTDFEQTVMHQVMAGMAGSGH